ncbi:hypothetical protein MRX96_001891 [Rhipicephalus microplus]
MKRSEKTTPHERRPKPNTPSSRNDPTTGQPTRVATRLRRRDGKVERAKTRSPSASSATQHMLRTALAQPLESFTALGGSSSGHSENRGERAPSGAGA